MLGVRAEVGSIVKHWWQSERSSGFLHPVTIGATLLIHVSERNRGTQRDSEVVGNDLSWWLISSLASAALSHRSAPQPLERPSKPLWGAAVSFVADDFARWGAHVIRHRSSVLWAFHSVHHTSADLGGTSSFRVHPVDRVAGVVLTRSILRCLLYTSPSPRDRG